MPSDARAARSTRRAPHDPDRRPRVFAWGERTFVMGILNVTPDSFSGDGLLAARARRGTVDGGAAPPSRRPTMVDEGADLLDIGGESTRPGHAPVDAARRSRRVVPVVAAIRAALPDMPISVDTTKPGVAEAALDAGADLVNDVWGVAADDALARARRRAWRPDRRSCTTARRPATRT